MQKNLWASPSRLLKILQQNHALFTLLRSYLVKSVSVLGTCAGTTIIKCDTKWVQGQFMRTDAQQRAVAYVAVGFRITRISSIVHLLMQVTLNVDISTHEQ